MNPSYIIHQHIFLFAEEVFFFFGICFCLRIRYIYSKFLYKEDGIENYDYDIFSRISLFTYISLVKVYVKAIGRHIHRGEIAKKKIMSQDSQDSLGSREFQDSRSSL